MEKRSRLVQPSFPSLAIELKRAVVVIHPIPLSHRNSYTVSQYSRALYYFVALLKKNVSTTTKKKISCFTAGRGETSGFSRFCFFVACSQRYCVRA